MHKSGFIFTVGKDLLESAKNLNLDSVFINHKNISKENLLLIRNVLGKNIEIFVEVPAFAEKELLEKYPDAKSIEAQGKSTSKNGYVGLCPTHLEIRKICIENVKKILEEDINGIWLDFIRYPTKWEEPEPDVLDTCYCDRCLKLFEEYIGEPIIGETLEDKVLLIDGSYYLEWLEFKAEQITSLVRNVRELINESGKNIKLGFFTIPWEDKEFGAGIKRIMGQDFGQLANYVDIFSPMLYHRMCGKEVEWIKGKVEYFWNVMKPFLPLIQTENKISKINTDEFKKALEYAALKPSMGVCIFFLDDLIKQRDKLEIAKKFFEQN